MKIPFQDKKVQTTIGALFVIVTTAFSAGIWVYKAHNQIVSTQQEILKEVRGTVKTETLIEVADALEKENRGIGFTVDRAKEILRDRKEVKNQAPGTSAAINHIPPYE